MLAKGKALFITGRKFKLAKNIVAIGEFFILFAKVVYCRLERVTFIVIFHYICRDVFKIIIFCMFNCMFNCWTELTLSHIQQICSRRQLWKCQGKNTETLSELLNNYGIKLKTLLQMVKLLIMSNFTFCNNDFQKSSATEASESIFILWERVKQEKFPCVYSLGVMKRAHPLPALLI